MSLNSSDYITLQVRIPKWVRELLDRYGIDLEKIIQKVIESEAKRILLEEVKLEIDKLRRNLLKIPDDEIVRLIREDREGR